MAKPFWRIALPLIVAGFSTPLLGIVDTIVITRTADLTAIGAVAIGAVVFNTIYWLFGFLKVSTSGFTAQAFGRRHEKEVALTLLHPLLIGFGVGILFLCMTSPLVQAAHFVFVSDSLVGGRLETYMSTRLVAAPFALGTYVILGWLIGQGRVNTSLALQVGGNVLNIGLSVWLIQLLPDAVFAVALATASAETVTCLVGLYIARKPFALATKRDIGSLAPYVAYLTVNRDLFIRTVFLLAMTGWFTSLGATQGVIALSANSILLQIHYLIAYWFSGIGQATTVLLGQRLGAGAPDAFRQTLRVSGRSIVWSVAIVTGLLYGLKTPLFHLFTDDDALFDQLDSFFVWILMYPLVGATAMWLEGVYAGMRSARPVRDSLVLAFLVFAVTIITTESSLGNHAIWLAFTLFTLTRSLYLIFRLKDTESSQTYRQSA